MEYYLQKKKIIKNREMRNFTFKGLFLAVVFIVLGSLSIQAADDGLITRQVTIKLEKAGTLPDKIGSTKKFQITNLKIIGEINGTDLRMIREMAGCNWFREFTEGKLAILDLSEAKIVSGGDSYINYGAESGGKIYYINDDGTAPFVFYKCSSLTSVSLPSGAKHIDYAAFEGCSSLTNVVIPSGVTAIWSYAFYNCSSLTNINIPSGVTEIDAYTFEGCSSLTNVVIPSGVTAIWSRAFYNCRRLTNVVIPSSVTTIRSQAFSGCSSLTNITIPSSITEIMDNAFNYCYGLTSIYVYIKQIPKMGRDVFWGCDAKKCTVYVPKGTYDDYWLSEFGYFENIVEFNPTGINNVITSNDAKELSRYSVNGQRLSAPTKGLNIVKYSDGSVKKVVVQ